MADNRWIRINNGYAGRNGYILKSEDGYISYIYGDVEPYATFEMAREAKKAIDSFGETTNE